MSRYVSSVFYIKDAGRFRYVPSKACCCQMRLPACVLRWGMIEWNLFCYSPDRHGTFQALRL